MVKLSLKEIRFIENYLIKNEVKYWDVRLELLDHIINSVEEKMTNKGLSFNAALQEVHQGFGNNLKTYGIYNHKLMKSGLYADKKGFEKFTKQKQKELGRKYRNQAIKTFKNNMLNYKFIVEYLAFSGLVLTVFQYFPKITVFSGLLILMLPTFYGFYHTFEEKALKKSLSFNMVGTFSILYWSIYNLGLQSLTFFYEKTEPKPYEFFVIMLVIMYPFLRSSMNLYLKILKENKALYKLKLS